MSLKEQLQADLKKAMLERDQLRLDTLRLVVSAVKNQEIQNKAELDDAAITKVLASEAKKRQDSIEAYTKGGRVEMAEKEKLEKNIIASYLPEQLTEEKVEVVVKETIAELHASIADFGRVMGAVMAKLKGQADGNMVSALVKKNL